MATKVALPNGCSRSAIKCIPKDWNTTPKNKAAEKALMAKNWKIYYRYYDPVYKGTKKWGWTVEVKGMNNFKDISTRQQATRELIDNEMEKVDKQSYNPITDTFSVPEIQKQETTEVTKLTPFIAALRKARELVTVCNHIRMDMKSIIKAIEQSSSKLVDTESKTPYSNLPISRITKKHLVYIFKQCEKDNPKFSPHRQNKYRTNLMILFKALMTVEAVDADPVSSIPIRRDWVRQTPDLLTEAEALIIDTNLKAWDYHFWRFMRIFYRSGSRATELFRLKRDGKINLEKQEFKIVVRKGKNYTEQVRPIPDDALDFWTELYEDTKPGEYFFSTSFKPGNKQLYEDQASKRWLKYVINDPGKYDPHGLGWGLGIKKGFYELKHRNTDRIADKIDLQHAAAADGHTNTRTTEKHYAIHEGKRRMEALKKVKIDF